MTKEKMENDNLVSVISMKTYNSICNEVFDYMHSFTSDDPVLLQNYGLKQEHINRVIGYTEVLTRNLELDQDYVLQSQIIALLHDIGRFEQFNQFKTFNDSLSVDHAELAVEIIDKKGWLNELPVDIQNNIKKAVNFHNKIAIPKNEGEDVILLSKIIRDADKIDILAMAIQEYSPQNKNKNQFFSLELENKQLVSKPIAKAIMAGKLPDKKEMKTVTDFKLVQMAYVFDIYFKKTYSIINKKQYLKQLFETLPKSDQVFEIYRKAKIHVENQLIWNATDYLLL